MTVTGFGPSTEPTKEQLEYSKKLYGEGEAAMAAEDYALALEKFKEGYRYAPNLHMFTFNIASAADAMDDCRTAQAYYQMFVDLVPKHAKRKAAKQRLATLSEQCRSDPETETLNTPPAEGEAPEADSHSRMSRAQREALRAMNGALAELRAAQRTYETAKQRYPQVKAFARAARRKKRHFKRLRKVAVELGVKLEDPGAPEIKVADTAKQACREAESQEKRIVSLMEAVLEHYDAPKAYRVGNQILRAADRRDRMAFDACS